MCVSRTVLGFSGADTGVREDSEPVVPVRRVHPLRRFQRRNLAQRCVWIYRGGGETYTFVPCSSVYFALVLVLVRGWCV